MRIFIQIPCLNEETTLPLVLAGIPKQIDGVDEIHVLVVDDGSSDRTVEVARQLGVEHFVFHTRNMGLARSFRDGVDYALQHGADIVINTDGDNQYPQERIADLVQPILRGEADIVIGDRQTKTIAHFSGFKKIMQGVGSSVVNFAAETDLPDAASGVDVVQYDFQGQATRASFEDVVAVMRDKASKLPHWPTAAAHKGKPCVLTALQTWLDPSRPPDGVASRGRTLTGKRRSRDRTEGLAG